MSNRLYHIFYLVAFAIFVTGQAVQAQVAIEGYAFESDNRGYLNAVSIEITDKSNGELIDVIQSNAEGYFVTDLPADKTYTLVANKSLFHPTRQDFTTQLGGDANKVFLKVELNRQPGYMFDVTLAAAKMEGDSVADAISGAWIEVFNNTNEELVLELKDYPHPNFAYTFQQGNHYTILIRKEGYFAKRLEAMVNVDGCILCFDGLASLENVTDNLTEGLQMGSLLANVELKRAAVGDKFSVDNLLYASSSAEISRTAAQELDKLATILHENPGLIVELGSHTDSKGKAKFNMELADQRAKAAVAHLILKGIDPDRIVARGYGESELLNDCADGITCTEDQHAINRRTEVKVIGLRDPRKANVSLLEIKEQEKFSRMLEEVQQQEQVQVGEEAPLPEEISNDIMEDAPVTTAGEEEPMMRDTLDLAAETELEIVVGRPLRKHVSDRADESISEADDFGDKLREVERPPVALVQAGEPIPVSFTGYMIELAQTGVRLGPGHPIVRDFEQVYWEKLPSNEHSYLVGRFEDIQQALLYLEDYLLADYASAKVIEFVQGVRK